MPPHANLEKLIGTALVDGEFRSNLLDSPVAAATGFELTREEMEVLKSAHASTLEELADFIYSWISSLPRPQRATQRRWAFDGGTGVRVAV
ncbi:MAG TPA: Franean1_4349 family RiPP [Chloroflexota bacterium]